MKKVESPFLGYIKYFTSLFMLFFLGCFHPTKVPIDRLYYEKKGLEKNHILFVFLPGRGDKPIAFEKNGFIESVRHRELDIDMVVTGAHLGYYLKRNLLLRLEKDIIQPAKANGYKRIWLIGISMGGLGALLYTRDHPDEIEGVVLLGPFLGEEQIIKEINQAGGIQKWNPTQTSGEDWQRDLWLWLKKYGQQRDVFPPIYLGYGKGDRFSPAHRLLTPILSPEHIIVIEGTHDWITFRMLWEIFLQKIKNI